MTGFIVQIPLPPSSNGIYANKRSGGGKRSFGRVKTEKYKNWRDNAGKEVMIQRPRPVAGQYRALLTLPKSMNGDPDNRIKAALDLLVYMGLVEGDSKKHCLGVRVDLAPDGLPDRAVVGVEPA